MLFTNTNVNFLFVYAIVPPAGFVIVSTLQFFSERTSSWPRLRKLREVRTRARWLRGLQEETQWHLFLVSNCQWQVHNWSFCDKHSFHLAWGRGLPRALSVTMARIVVLQLGRGGEEENAFISCRLKDCAVGQKSYHESGSVLFAALWASSICEIHTQHQHILYTLWKWPMQLQNV